MKRLFLLLILVFLEHQPASGFECVSTTYSGLDFTEPQARFSPYDKIYLKISCKRLTDGQHSLHINWVHNKKGIVRSAEQVFTISKNNNDYVGFFWFKLTRKGPFKSMLTNQDFYEENFGDWIAQGYFGDTLITSSAFTISEGEQRPEEK